MSMMGEFREITPALLRRIKDEPSLVQGVVLADSAQGEVQRPPEDLGERISIDKAWHGLHFLLTGSAEPTTGDASLVVMGGAEIGDDGGYGPARYLEVNEVRRVSAALQALSVADLQGRYDAAAMEAMDIYPGGWDDAENL